mgnify:CR=1 FL=1
MTAHKILPEHNIVQAVNYVLDKHILELENVIAQAQTEQRYMGGSSLKLLVELLKDPDMVFFPLGSEIINIVQIGEFLEFSA